MFDARPSQADVEIDVIIWQNLWNRMTNSAEAIQSW